MDEIPAEILIVIFRNLHLKQKLECMLVCNKWAQILRDGYLFETLELSVLSTYESFNNDFISLAEKTRSGPGKKCSRLAINNSSNIHVDGATLAQCFPNLNFLWYKEHIIIPKRDPLGLAPTESDPFQGWRANLETFFGSAYVENHVLDCFFTGIFYRLKTLDVGCYDLYQSDLLASEYCSKLISKLGNMPALTTLLIQSESLKIKDLEEIHKNAPGLISLTLKSGFQTNLEDISLLEIVPAENMKVFKTVEFYSDGPVLDTLLMYAKLKYTHLDEYYHYETHHRHNFSLSTPVFSNTVWHDFIPAVGPNLKKCTITLKHKATGIFDFMETYMHQLESLNVDVFKFKKVFKKIVSREAFLNLRSLTLRQLPYDFKMSDFKKLTKLENLTLDLSRNSTQFDDGRLYPVSLGDIVKGLPGNIEMLTLDFAQLDSIVEDGTEEIQGDSNIVDLKLLNSHIMDESTSSYLTHHFKKLKSLAFINCKMVASIELPNHHLSYFEIAPPDLRLGTDDYTEEGRKECDMNNTHIKITSSDHTHHYKLTPVQGTAFTDLDGPVASGDDYAIQKTLKPSVYDENLNYFHLKCANVETVYYYNYHLLL